MRITPIFAAVLVAFATSSVVPLRAADLDAEYLQKVVDAGKKLQEAKDEAVNLANSYTKTAETADAVSKKVEKLVGDPVVEVIVLAHGQNFALSWLDLAEGLVPALWARADAAKGLEKRLDSAIKLAKADLEGFEASRQGHAVT